jgi:hypothetical protein
MLLLRWKITKFSYFIMPTYCQPSYDQNFKFCYHLGTFTCVFLGGMGSHLLALIFVLLVLILMQIDDQWKHLKHEWWKTCYTLGWAPGDPITTDENRWNVPYSACSIVHKILNIQVWNSVELTNCKLTCFEQKNGMLFYYFLHTGEGLEIRSLPQALEMKKPKWAIWLLFYARVGLIMGGVIFSYQNFPPKIEKNK